MTLPLIIDSFAGGGGASTGIEMALGRSPDIAINHSADALAMHAVNHPGSCISTATSGLAPDRGDEGPAGRALVGLARLQAFLEAKGGKPLDATSAISPGSWCAGEEFRPDVILLENVEEFRTWGPIYEDGTAIPQLRGQRFRLGAAAEEAATGCRRELRACDYGAPTIRKRLFLVARRDGLPIVWPARTHGDPRKAADAKLIRAGRLKPWRRRPRSSTGRSPARRSSTARPRS